jgi:cyclopropane fatty-acyl-phospholipid synthase-like methyltransferase
LTQPAGLDFWDKWNAGRGPWYPHAKVIQFCLRRYRSGTRGSIRALDLGCGSGANTWFLAREGFATTATDFSPNAIQMTAARLAEDGLNATLRVEPATDIAEADGTLDLVLCIGVLDAMGSRAGARAVREVERTLASGGRALFIAATDRDFRLSDPSSKDILHGYSRPEIEDLFSGIGDVSFDTYETTHEGGTLLQSDWMVTIEPQTA